MPWSRRPQSVALLVALGLAALGPCGAARAQSAVMSGSWGTPSTWSGSAVPAPGATVFVGTSAGVTVSLDAPRSPGTVYVGAGNAGGAAVGTLDLAGFRLTTDQFFLGDEFGASATLARSGGGTLAVAGTLGVDGGVSRTNQFAFAADDSSAALLMTKGARATTASAGNVTATVTLSGGSTLTLGAALLVTGAVTITGNSTLTQNGSAITAASLSITGSTLTARVVPGSPAGLTLTNSSASALSIGGGGKLAFALDGAQPGVAFRWLNPTMGDHVAELAALIASPSGAVTITLTNGASSQIVSQGGYTLLIQPVPEPAAVLLAGASGLAGWRARRRRG